MAVFPSFNLTKKGEELLNRSIGEGRVLTFTKFKLGDGVPTEDWRDLVNVQSSFKEFSVLETAIQADQVLRIRGYFDNKGFATDKQFKEIGVFVTLDGVAGEHLYSYTNAGDTGDIIPAESRGFYSRTLDVNNYIGYATNITFNIEQTRDNYDFNIENEVKIATFLKKGDKIRLWGRLVLGDIETLNYIVTDEVTSFILDNGLYCKLAGDNIASNIKTDLVNLKGAVVGDVVEVLGFHTKGDGSHHKRIAKSEDDGSGEQGQDGIWWCLLTQKTLQNYKIPFEGLNVKWFGARGDNTSDDTVAFNRAFKFNNANNGYRVIVPAGQYIVTELVCNKAGTQILGTGSYSTIIRVVGGGVAFKFQPLFAGNPWTNSVFGNLIVKDLMFYANDDTTRTQGTGTLLIDTFVAKFENVRWFGFDRCSDHSGCHFISYDTCYWGGNKFIKHPSISELDLSQMEQLTDYTGSSICGNDTITGVEAIKGCTHMKISNCWFSFCSPDFTNISNALVDTIDIEPSNKTFLIGGSSNKFINCRFERMDLHVISDESKRYPWVNITGKNNVFETCWVHTTGLNNFIEKNPLFVVSGEKTVFNNCSLGLEYGVMKNKNAKTTVKTHLEERLQSTYGLNYDTNLTELCRGYSEIKLGNGFYLNKSLNKIEHNMLKCENLANPYYQNLSQKNATDFEVTAVSAYSNRIVYNYSSAVGDYTGSVVCLAKITNQTTRAVNVAFLTQQTQTQEFSTLQAGESKYLVSYGINDGSMVFRPTITFLDVQVGDLFKVEDVHILCDKENKFTKSVLLYVEVLDTPYYTLKMQQEGVYEDYVAYRDELFEYENSQTTDETMMLPVLQEPVIPESIKAFAEKYKLI